MPGEEYEGESTGVPPAAQSTESPGSPAPPFPSIPPAPPAFPVQCANCEAILTGPFCSQCGQHVADYHRSVWALVTNFFDNVFAWDSKVFRTLGPLLAQPGVLTVEFMSGRRVRYVHPLRLFLFTSAVCLTLLQFSHHSLFKLHTDRNAERVKKRGQFHFNVGAPPDDGAKDDGDDNDDDDASPSPRPSPSASVAPAPGSPAPALGPGPAAGPATAAANPAASPAPAASPRSLSAAAKEGADHEQPDALERHLEGIGERVQDRIDKMGPEEFNRQVAENAQARLSWVALAILPIFAMLLRSLYWRRDSFYFVHLIFSLHYHTFLLMFWTGYTWLSVAADNSHFWPLQFLVALCLLVWPWYLFRSLRRLFGESRRRTFAKVAVIFSVHLLALLIGLAAVGVLSVFSVTSQASDQATARHRTTAAAEAAPNQSATPAPDQGRRR